MSDLEQLAAAGRAKKKQAPRKRKRPVQPDPPAPPKEELARSKRAVLNAVGPAPTLIVLSVLGVAAGLLIGFLAGATDWAGLGAAIGAVIAFAVYFLAVAPVLYSRELRWLEALPYELDVQTYLRRLGKERSKTRITVRVFFADPVPEDKHELVCQAGDGMHTDARASINDGALVLAATYKTRFGGNKPSSRSSDRDPYRNHKVHKFVRTILRNGLPVLHASYPIERITIKLS